MTDFAEIKGLVEKINPTLTELRSEVDGLKESIPADVITQEKFDRMSDDITAKMASLQDAQAKMKAALDRPGAGESGDKDLGRKEFGDFLRKGVDLNGNDRSDTKFTMEVRAMSTDVNPQGGYLVRPEFIDRTVGRIFETSPVRQVASVLTGSAKAIEMLIDDDEATANRTGEGSASSDTDTPDLGLKVITAHKYDAAPRMTTEMVEDAYFDVESWLQGKVSRKIARMENTDFVVGNGVGRARGFMTYDAWASAGVYERDKIEQINMGNASALTADGLIDVQSALIEDYQAGASWAMHRSTFGKALQLKGADNYYFSPVLMRDGQATIQLLGKPVTFMSDVAEVAANALAIAYGDFSEAYTIYDRIGLQILRDPYSTHGFITYYTYKRTGGDVTSFDALKIGKVAA